MIKHRHINHHIRLETTAWLDHMCGSPASSHKWYRSWSYFFTARFIFSFFCFGGTDTTEADAIYSCRRRQTRKPRRPARGLSFVPLRNSSDWLGIHPALSILLLPTLPTLSYYSYLSKYLLIIALCHNAYSTPIMTSANPFCDIIKCEPAVKMVWWDRIDLPWHWLILLFVDVILQGGLLFAGHGPCCMMWHVNPSSFQSLVDDGPPKLVSAWVWRNNEEFI